MSEEIVKWKKTFSQIFDRISDGPNKFSIGKKCNEFTVLYNLKECGYEITKKEAKIIAREVRRRLSTKNV